MTTNESILWNRLDNNSTSLEQDRSMGQSKARYCECTCFYIIFLITFASALVTTVALKGDSSPGTAEASAFFFPLSIRNLQSYRLLSGNDFIQNNAESL